MLDWYDRYMCGVGWHGFNQHFTNYTRNVSIARVLPHVTISLCGWFRFWRIHNHTFATIRNSRTLPWASSVHGSIVVSPSDVSQKSYIHGHQLINTLCSANLAAKNTNLESGNTMLYIMTETHSMYYVCPVDWETTPSLLEMDHWLIFLIFLWLM